MGDLPGDLARLAVELVAEPKEERAQAGNERVDLRRLVDRLDELYSWVVSALHMRPAMTCHLPLRARPRRGSRAPTSRPPRATA